MRVDKPSPDPPRHDRARPGHPRRRMRQSCGGVTGHCLGQAPGIALAGPAWVTGTRPVMTAEGAFMRVDKPSPDPPRHDRARPGHPRRRMRQSCGGVTGQGLGQAPGIALAGPAWVTGTRPVMTAEGAFMRVDKPSPDPPRHDRARPGHPRRRMRQSCVICRTPQRAWTRSRVGARHRARRPGVGDRHKAGHDAGGGRHAGRQALSRPTAS